MSLDSSSISSKLLSQRSRASNSISLSTRSDSVTVELEPVKMSLRQLSLNGSLKNNRLRLREAKSNIDAGFIEKDIANLREKTRDIESQIGSVRLDAIRLAKLYKKEIENKDVSGASVDLQDAVNELKRLKKNIERSKDKIKNLRENIRQENVKRTQLLQTLIEHRKKEREAIPVSSPKASKNQKSGKTQSKNLLSPYVSELRR